MEPEYFPYWAEQLTSVITDAHVRMYLDNESCGLLGVLS